MSILPDIRMVRKCFTLAGHPDSSPGSEIPSQGVFPSLISDDALVWVFSSPECTDLIRGL